MLSHRLVSPSIFDISKNNFSRKAREEREEKTRRKREREMKRKEKIDEKKRAEEEKRVALNIAKEESNILIAQRKLESIRLLTELIDRVKVSLSLL